MSSLIDIWTLERERMVRAAAAAQAFRSVVSLGGDERRGRRDTARSEAGRSSCAAKPCDGVGAVLVDAAEKQAAASASASAGSSPPGVRPRRRFLVHPN
uniref:Uncharacterized protein n=1 Tax=Saccharum hybrid cultivar R570 TaxID=131158 RepID=A0A059Q164_9POAL|nr:hypothetical protein SHCRBa_028_E10_R_200 [Saccharum hybrid cultivar R570]